MWEKFRNRLEQMRNDVHEQIHTTGQFGLDTAMRDELGELSMYDNHPADIASELYERGKDVALRDAQKLRLQGIERALEAIDDGSYGFCANCKERIAPERLDANPFATLCVVCKRRDEKLHPNRNRPVEEEFMWPGYGRTQLDDTENVGFDGEDSWQAVERYNQRPEFEGNDEQVPLDDNEGIVDELDEVSNEQYRRQLP